MTAAVNAIFTRYIKIYILVQLNIPVIISSIHVTIKTRIYCLINKTYLLFVLLYTFLPFTS